VANVDNPADPNTQIPVFGELDTDRFSVVIRANITFTKDLSLQFYNQMFFASGAYNNFKALTSSDSFGPLAQGLYTENPDFNSRSMNVKRPVPLGIPTRQHPVPRLDAGAQRFRHAG
jgi:hypothetical protein